MRISILTIIAYLFASAVAAYCFIEVGINGILCVYIAGFIMVLLNPIIKIYERRIKARDKRRVSQWVEDICRIGETVDEEAFDK
jgi:predicted PurR-regulated permease PerM